MSEVVEALPPYLTEREINDMCRPLTQNAARIRYLKGLGLFVKTFPGGAPHVARSEYERVMGAGRVTAKVADRAPGSEPDHAATLALLNQRKSRNGSKTQGR